MCKHIFEDTHTHIYIFYQRHKANYIRVSNTQTNLQTTTKNRVNKILIFQSSKNKRCNEIIHQTVI